MERQNRKMNRVIATGIAVMFLLPLLLGGCSWLGLSRKPKAKQKFAPVKVRRKAPVRKVDLDLAKLVIVEQQASRENMRRLAEGQIKGFAVDGATRQGGKAIVKVTCSYSDNSTLGGYIEFVYENGLWYLSSITRESPYPPSTPSTDDLSQSLIEMGKGILKEQAENQQLITDIVGGEVKSVVVDDVATEPSSSLLDITLLYDDGSTVKGNVKLKYRDGYWYLTKIVRASS